MTEQDSANSSSLRGRASRPANIRSQNERLVLDVLRTKGKATRAELAEATSLTLPAISSITQGLADEGVVIEHRDPRADGGRGRPPVVVEFLANSRYVVAISLNRVNTQILIADALGKDIASRTIPNFEDASPAAVIATLRRLIVLLMSDANIDADQISAVGVTIGGSVDGASGIVAYAPRLNWRDVPLRDLLADDFAGLLGDIPIHVIDAGRAVAVAEATEGKAFSLRNVIVVDVGATVSAAIIQNGRITNGANGLAGHLGACQIPVINLDHKWGDPEPPRRTIDYYASTQGMYDRYIEKRPDQIKTSQSVRLVLDAVSDRDQDAVDVLVESGVYLALGLSWLVNLLDPDHIVLTGALGTLDDVYQNAIIALIQDRLSEGQAERLEIRYSDRGIDGWLRGAVMAALQDNSISLAHLFDRALIA